MSKINDVRQSDFVVGERRKSESLLQQTAAGGGVGALAGVAMAGWAMVTSLVNGDGFLKPVQLIAATFYGENALTLTLPVLVVGLVLHMATSIMLGAVLGPFMSRSKPLWQSQALAVGWGIAAWAAFTFVILPKSNTVMHESTDRTPINWFIGHILFGLVLGFTPILTAWVSREPRPKVMAR